MPSKPTFATVRKVQVISVNHHQFPLETIGQFHLNDEHRLATLLEMKKITGCEEIMYVATCNRVEWVFTLDHFVCPGLSQQVLQLFCTEKEEDFLKSVAQQCLRLEGEEAAEHLLRTAGSLNSAVIGETEILGQMRAAYEYSAKVGLAGEALRIAMKQCIKSAKQIFTETDLRRKPVSIVSIAWNAFLEKGLSKDAPIALVGAGQIISNFAKFLSENGFHHITVFNRSETSAQKIIALFDNGKFMPLSQLQQALNEHTVWVVCTGATEYLITEEMIAQMTKKTKMVIDLAMPGNVHPAVQSKEGLAFFDMNNIQQITNENLAFRQMALDQCEPLILQGMMEYKGLVQERKIELAMQNIPLTIKEIRETALGSVFQKDLMDLDENAKEVLEKILDYMEKKYISVPMKMAKAVMMEQHQKN
ncbi:MAG: glutamyl-tRNA reductase [Bacteroidota bacterium]